MSTEETPGQAMHNDDTDARREAARMMGKARSERKAAAVRANGLKGGAHPFTEETRAKLRAAQATRRAREREERLAREGVAQPQEKKPVGRPRTRPTVQASEKRTVGRPKKQAGQMTLLEANSSENGAQRQGEEA